MSLSNRIVSRAMRACTGSRAQRQHAQLALGEGVSRSEARDAEARLLQARLVQALQQLSHNRSHRRSLILGLAVVFLDRSAICSRRVRFLESVERLPRLRISIAQGKGRHQPGVSKPEILPRIDRFPKSVSRFRAIAVSEMRASFGPKEYIL